MRPGPARGGITSYQPHELYRTHQARTNPNLPVRSTRIMKSTEYTLRCASVCTQAPSSGATVALSYHLTHLHTHKLAAQHAGQPMSPTVKKRASRGARTSSSLTLIRTHHRKGHLPLCGLLLFLQLKMRVGEVEPDVRQARIHGQCPLIRLDGRGGI